MVLSTTAESVLSNTLWAPSCPEQAPLVYSSLQTALCRFCTFLGMSLCAGSNVGRFGTESTDVYPVCSEIICSNCFAEVAGDK
eukprot:3260254-Amphidinium_carterae.1